MNRLEFIKQLRATADVLAPLCRSTSPGTREWNGSAYAETDQLRRPDPHALAWRATLTVVAELLEAQGTPPTANQLRYIEHLFLAAWGA
jgi:hypothetical protein